jgi:hypothetical protein
VRGAGMFIITDLKVNDYALHYCYIKYPRGVLCSSLILSVLAFCVKEILLIVSELQILYIRKNIYGSKLTGRIAGEYG